MSYDYKILNVDPSSAFVKRVALYIAILVTTISVALLILYILFERYLMLILPGVLIALSILVFVAIGRVKTAFSYHFSDLSLCLQDGKTMLSFNYDDLKVIREANNNDYADKDAKIYTFQNNRLVLKGVSSAEDLSSKAYILMYKEEKLILALDDYALALIGGIPREV